MFFKELIFKKDKLILKKISMSNKVSKSKYSF